MPCRVRERVVRLEELAGRRFWLVNSVRGWQEGMLVDALDNPSPGEGVARERARR